MTEHRQDDGPPLADLPLYWQGRANALGLLNDRRVVPDEGIKQQIETYEECAKELRLALASRDAAEGAGDALARENHWRRLEGRDPAPPKPAPDAREAIRDACIAGVSEHGIQCALCGETLHDNDLCDDAECPIGGSFTVRPSGTGAAEPGKRWYVGAQNDGLFIVNAEPRPSNDHPWHDNPNGPTVALNVTELPLTKAQRVVDVMNGLAPPVRGDLEEQALDHRVIQGREDWFLLAHELSEARNAYLNGMGQQGSAARRMRLEELLWNDKGTFIQVLQAMSLSLPVQSGAGEREAIKRAVCCPDGCQYEGDSEDGNKCYCDTSDYRGSGVEKRANAVFAVFSRQAPHSGHCPVCHCAVCLCSLKAPHSSRETDK